MEKKTNDKKVVDLTARVCKFDPRRDVQEVIPDLGVNIDDMLQTGIVKDSGETLDNNGIDNPDLIIGRIRDAFDALDAARIIKKYGRKPQKAQSEVSNLTDANNSSNTNE